MTLQEAKKLAREHGCFVLTKLDHFILYREMEVKNVFIGRRNSEQGMVALVKKVCRSA